MVEGNRKEHQMAGTILVLGASGNIGSRVAEAFAAAGWTVRRFVRGTDMAAAAVGADVIFNGLNPPMYHDWARLIPEITAAVIAAGRASGATVVIPGNVYPYGTEAPPWGPDTPHRPVARKGRIRAEMEAQLKAAGAQGLRVIILRAGDFLDERSGTTAMNAFHLRRVKAGVITAGGAVDVPRAYAYLPDMARAVMALVERRADLRAFADIPFAGLTFTMTELRDEMGRQMGRPLVIKPFAWWMMRLLGPFWELARELPEMRYLYETPHWLDPAPLQAILPGFAGTTLADVVAAHVAVLGIGSGQRHIDPDKAVA
jgi:nucleoside-diphosphate-sugar epimerase